MEYIRGLEAEIVINLYLAAKKKEMNRMLWEEWCALQPYCEETFPQFKHKRENPTQEQINQYNNFTEQTPKRKLTKEEVFARVAKIRGKAGE
ncbi:hypothetical protein P4K63_00405 [Bacillus cereus]|uniref:hypothetical protein n=1 Tax=Bacillus cereus TaxID=1396 RepID=UPI0020D28A27|nr:hypothetical protein [Bacillus cereus]MEB9828773.1 hypothetical protein [Bacillus cereus]